MSDKFSDRQYKGPSDMFAVPDKAKSGWTGDFQTKGEQNEELRRLAQKAAEARAQNSIAMLARMEVEKVGQEDAVGKIVSGDKKEQTTTLNVLRNMAVPRESRTTGKGDGKVFMVEVPLGGILKLCKLAQLRPSSAVFAKPLDGDILASLDAAYEKSGPEGGRPKNP